MFDQTERPTSSQLRAVHLAFIIYTHIVSSETNNKLIAKSAHTLVVLAKYYD